MDTIQIIKTSEERWYEKALQAYSEKQTFRLVDDAGLGFRENDLRSAVSLLKALKEKKAVSWKDISALLVGLGISGAGVWMVLAAIADPEPTSKLGLLIGGGVMLALTGSLGALSAMGVKFRVSGKSFGNEFVIEPGKEK